MLFRSFEPTVRSSWYFSSSACEIASTSFCPSFELLFKSYHKCTSRLASSPVKTPALRELGMDQQECKPSKAPLSGKLAAICRMLQVICQLRYRLSAVLLWRCSSSTRTYLTREESSHPDNLLWIQKSTGPVPGST